jgi:ABC-type oligopeptide transport system ATPase subunit
VPNPSLSRAQQILNKHHYCIIVGIPGIGKTTLAEILLIDYADRQGFQAIRIANDLSEIKEVKDPRRRQIFYYDDFLGTAKLDKLEKNEDKRLMEFLQQVAANNKWRFLLTTREYILNTARIRYESLAQPAVELKPCIVDLADYTRPIRARILYNHIFFSDLPDAYKRALLEGLSCLSWKWRRRSSVKITERTYEERTEAFHSRRKSSHSEATSCGQSTRLGAV